MIIGDDRPIPPARPRSASSAVAMTMRFGASPRSTMSS
jgi:hypothetical protein